MEHKIAIKKVSSPLEITSTSVKYRCDMKEFIDSKRIPEMVQIGDGLFMLADEEGRLKRLKHNFYIFFPYNDIPIQTIIGSVAFVRIKPVTSDEELYDYEIDSLTDEDIRCINALLDASWQIRLKNAFIAKYKDEENPVGYWRTIIKPIL